jgi:protease-4
MLDSIGRNPRYRAVILDINSPGGSAGASDLLYHAVRKVAQRKPVVAYVRGIGASGGYYLCCAATKVIALPTALVGSIGVIYVQPILEQLLARVGVEMSVYKSGPLKDMTGFWQRPSDQAAEKFQSLIAEMFDTFVGVVAQGRSMEEDKVREIATGEVYTARAGHEMGLVDELGDFDEAVVWAAVLGNARPRPRLVRPRRTLAERLAGRGESRPPGLASLSADLAGLLAGGMYFLEPSLLSAEHWPGWGF